MYVFRELAIERLDSLMVLEVSMDGAPLPEGAGVGQAEIAGADPVRVTWHFAPTSDSTHTFILRYRVQGAIETSPEGDRLRWFAIPPDHGYPIAFPSGSLVSAPPEWQAREQRIVANALQALPFGLGTAVLTLFAV